MVPGRYRCSRVSPPGSHNSCYKSTVSYIAVFTVSRVCDLKTSHTITNNLLNVLNFCIKGNNEIIFSQYNDNKNSAGIYQLYEFVVRCDILPGTCRRRNINRYKFINMFLNNGCRASSAREYV